MGKNDEKISIIIPVYNVEKYIAECLKSITSQTYEKLEIIIVDDGSPDNSIEICQKFAKKDERIKIIRQKNKGLNGARKTGFENSTGDFVTFVDSDDAISVDFCEKLISQFDSKTDIVMCKYELFFNEFPEIIDSKNVTYFPKKEAVRRWIYEDFGTGNIFPQTAWGKLFRRRIIEKVNFEKSNFKINEDEFMSTMFYSAMKKGVKIVDKRMYFYRKNPNSITSNYNELEYKNSFNGEPVSRVELFERLADFRVKFFPKLKNDIFHIFAGQFSYSLREKVRMGGVDFSADRLAFDRKTPQIKKALSRKPIGGLRGEIIEFCFENGVENMPNFFDNKPLISIIVPVYNVEKYISQCLESIKEQTYSKLEVILVDDGSSDGSGDICDSIVKKDRRFKVFHIKNGGVSRARNFGISKAAGDYICFVDSDDYLPLDSIENMAKHLHDNDMDIVNAALTFKHKDFFNFYNISHAPNDRVFSKDTVSDTEILAFWDGMNGPVAKLYRTDFIRKHKLKFPENIRIGEDLVFVIKALLLAEKAFSVNQSVYFYRKDNESSATRTASDKKFDFADALLEIRDFIREQKITDNKIINASKVGAVNHSYYALKCLRHSPQEMEEVFNFIKNDLWPKLEIDDKVKNIDPRRFEQPEAILMGEFPDFLNWTFSWYEKELRARDELIIHLSNIIEIIQSVKGSVRNVAGAGKRFIKRRVSKK